jgi:hypothetical protein
MQGADPAALTDRLPTAVHCRLRDHPSMGHQRMAQAHTFEPDAEGVHPEELSKHG